MQHEAAEEGQEEESATAAATLASAAPAALQRPPPYPRQAALPNEGEATGTPTSGLTAKQGSGLREPLLPHADPGPGSGGGDGSGVHAAAVAPGMAKGRRGGGLQAMPHTPLSRSLVFGMINAVAAIPTLIAFAASEGQPAMRCMHAAAGRAAWLAPGAWPVPASISRVLPRQLTSVLCTTPMQPCRLAASDSRASAPLPLQQHPNAQDPIHNLLTITAPPPRSRLQGARVRPLA